MPEQLSLAGFEDGTKPIDVLFFAFLPEGPAKIQVANLAQCECEQCGLTGASLESTRFHVSLHSVGNYEGLPRAVVAAAKEVATAITEAPFDVTFDRVMSFSGGTSNRHPMVLCGSDGLAALIKFQRTLGVAMIKAGVGRKVKRNFTPHMTLHYSYRTVEEHPVTPIRWTVRELVLIHSLHGQGQHIPLGRWPLRG